MEERIAKILSKVVIPAIIAIFIIRGIILYLNPNFTL
jgi:hypothetical protein